jgi:hypothetical protein
MSRNVIFVHKIGFILSELYWQFVSFMVACYSVRASVQVSAKPETHGKMLTYFFYFLSFCSQEPWSHLRLVFVIFYYLASSLHFQLS